ncbi:hypothetical protein V6N11_081398 [Hibiscus sabdariffa]|uniref:Uncharacterized protein n=1 Tax=Hibiscus sabdariffa TaxID=183260 RepID=A0ABR2QJQ9_9ROSI
MVPSSFDKGRVLIETSTLDRFDDHLVLCVNDKSQSTNEEERNLPNAKDHMVDEVQDHVEIAVANDGAECGSLIREEEEVVPVAHPPLQPVLDTDLDLVSVPIEEGVIEGLAFNVIGPAVEGSQAKVIYFKGSRRKVRMLADVIQSVSSSAEREERKKGSKGRGRQRPSRVDGSFAPIVDLPCLDACSCDMLEQPFVLEEVLEAISVGT